MLKINEDIIKLIVTDVDGTLLDNQHQIPDLVRNKLIELQKKGTFISIASGRMPLGFDQYTKVLEIKEYGSYVIGANGAIIYDSKKKEILYHNLMSKSEVFQVTNILLKYNCYFTISYHNDATLYCFGDKLLKNKLKPGAYIDGMKNVQGFKISGIKPTYKIVVKSDNIKTFTQAYEELTGMKELSVEKISKTACDIVHVDSTKGQSILKLITFLNQKYSTNITINNVLYFGDNNNDRSAFEILPYAIAINHAPKEVLELAYDVTTSNNVGGIYDYIKKIETK